MKSILLPFLFIYVTTACFFSHATALEITAVGDISLSKRLIDTRGADLQKIELSGDVVFANFEGVLSERHTHEDTLRLKLTMPPTAINIIKEIGINTLSLANNHINRSC